MIELNSLKTYNDFKYFLNTFTISIFFVLLLFFLNTVSINFTDHYRSFVGTQKIIQVIPDFCSWY